MKRIISLALALSMMFMCAGNVFAADYGDPSYHDSNHDLTLNLVMGEDKVDISVPAALSYHDSYSDSGDPINTFYATGTAVKKEIDEILTQDAYKKYADATWYLEEAFTQTVSFTKDDRFRSDLSLYAKLGKAPSTGATPDVSEEVKKEGILAEDITNTLPADKTLKLDIATKPSKTAESVVEDIANSDATLKAVQGSQPLYLDIKLVDAQGNAVQPGTSASITLPLPDKLQTALNGGANAVLVIHYNDDVSVKEKMLATLTDDGKMTFTVSSFSTFAFIAVEKTSFDVTIENVKGGILSVTDANGVMLPVGQKVAVPSKDKEGYSNTLYVNYAPLEDAVESDLLVNGASIGLYNFGKGHYFELNKDMVLTGVFEKRTPSSANKERYYVHVKPNTYNSTTPFSGTLQFKHRVDGKDTVLTDATFAFKNPAFDGQIFEISGTTLTSKQPLTKDDYSILMTVTAGGKTYEHKPSGIPATDCQAYIHLNRGEQYNVFFDRYHAEQIIPGDGPGLTGADVAKGTTFATIATDQEVFGNGSGGIILKDGKPQMYAYEFDRWQQYTWADDSDYPTRVNDVTITRDIDAIAMFKNYTVNVAPLEGGSTGGDGDNTGGGSSGGGGGGKTALLGGGLSTGIAQPVSATQAKTAANKAIASAKVSGSTQAIVKFKNAASISPAVLGQIADAAKKAGMSAMVYADTVVGGKIVARMYIDPAKMTRTGNLALGVTIGDKATEAKFAKQYSNPIMTLGLAQKGTFGAPVRLAVKLDLGKLNAKTLRFYSFDSKTGKVILLDNTQYAIGKDGYLFFYTEAANTIVISDRPLAKK